MSFPKLLSYSQDGKSRYGLVKGQGVVDLSQRFSRQWPTLREAVADNALSKLVEAGEQLAAGASLDEITFQIPIPSPEKIVCVGVNYPDRNEEYKDGQVAP